MTQKEWDGLELDSRLMQRTAGSSIIRQWRVVSVDLNARAKKQVHLVRVSAPAAKSLKIEEALTEEWWLDGGPQPTKNTDLVMLRFHD